VNYTNECVVALQVRWKHRRQVVIFAGTLKVISDERGTRWANELLPLVRKRVQVQRYSPPRPKHASPVKINIKNREGSRAVVRFTPKLHKRYEQPRTAEEEKSFGVYWKQVARTITFPKLLQRWVEIASAAQLRSNSRPVSGRMNAW